MYDKVASKVPASSLTFPCFTPNPPFWADLALSYPSRRTPSHNHRLAAPANRTTWKFSAAPPGHAKLSAQVM